MDEYSLDGAVMLAERTYEAAHPQCARLHGIARSVIPGGTINFTVANGPANRADWVGLFATASSNAYVAWSYLNGLETLPATGLSGVIEYSPGVVVSPGPGRS